MESKEQEVIKTFKSGLGLTSAEREILANYIDKLQKEIESKNKQIKLMQEMNLPKEIEINYINKDIIRDKIKKAEKNYESCSKGNVVEKAYYRNKIDTLKELLGE